MHVSPSSRLAEVSRSLPFAVNDFDAAREAFARWRRSRCPRDRQTVEVWGYCYTLWYFHAKFARERTAGASDLDDVIGRAYDRILRSLDAVRDPECFPQYVSVLCRNVLRNHRTRRRRMEEMDEHTAAVPAVGAAEYDRVVVHRVLERAIGELPPAIREVARMRLLDRRSYPDIAQATGRPIASVRTYASKAKTRLREDPNVRALYHHPPAVSARDARGGPSVGPTP